MCLGGLELKQTRKKAEKNTLALHRGAAEVRLYLPFSIEVTFKLFLPLDPPKTTDDPLMQDPMSNSNANRLFFLSSGNFT